MPTLIAITTTITITKYNNNTHTINQYTSHPQTPKNNNKIKKTIHLNEDYIEKDFTEDLKDFLLQFKTKRYKKNKWRIFKQNNHKYNG